MQFSIIYSVDCPRSVSIRRFAPPHARRLWDLTEGDEQYEYDYLGSEYSHGKHRKWCGLLTQEQFDDFISHTGLFAEDVQTMGSIGAPGFGWGWSPAISFRSDDPEAIQQSAYVTPVGSKAEIVEFLRQHEVAVPAILLDDDDQKYLWDDAVDREAPWEAVREAVITAYS